MPIDEPQEIPVDNLQALKDELCSLPRLVAAWEATPLSDDVPERPDIAKLTEKPSAVAKALQTCRSKLSTLADFGTEQAFMEAKTAVQTLCNSLRDRVRFQQHAVMWNQLEITIGATNAAFRKMPDSALEMELMFKLATEELSIPDTHPMLVDQHKNA